MVGFASFFRSERVSDMTLVFVLAQEEDLTAGDPSLPLPPTATPLLAGILQDSGASSNADGQHAGTKIDAGNEEVVMRFPAHKVILMGRSAYFNTRLCTALGGGAEEPPSSMPLVVREHASTLEELNAMEAVVEFLYTDKLSVVDTGVVCTDVKPTTGPQAKINTSAAQRLLSMLMVADRWQAPTCLAACCSAVCAMTTAAITWDDCYALYGLPHGLREQLDVIPVMEFAMKMLLALTSMGSVAVAHDILFAKLDKLPVSVRLALLQGCKLGYVGMLYMLRCSEQIADSEDSLIVFLDLYLKSAAGMLCSAPERKHLKDQIRYQHLSNSFVGLELVSMPELALDVFQLSGLVYLRGLKGFDVIPIAHRQPLIPEAWYLPSRVQAANPPDCSIVELTFNISESALSEHLTAAALLKTGGPAAAVIRGDWVDSKGMSWCMALQSTTVDRILHLTVQPRFGKVCDRDSTLYQTAGLYINVTYRLISASPIISGKSDSWIGASALGFVNFVQSHGGRPGSSTDISWWKDYITDGHVRFTATIKVM